MPVDRGNPRRFHRSTEWTVFNPEVEGCFFHTQRGPTLLISVCTATSPVVSECWALDDRGVRGGQSVDPQAGIRRLPEWNQPGTGSIAIVGPAPPPLKRQAFRPRSRRSSQVECTPVAPRRRTAGINPAIVISAETSPFPSISACSGVGGGPVVLLVLRNWGVWLNSRRGSGGALQFCSV